MYAAQKDANHDLVRDAFQRCGWHVEETYRFGSGFPDLLVTKDGGTVRGWITLLVEVKTPGGVLTKAEKRFHARYPGPLEIVRGMADVLRVHYQYSGIGGHDGNE